MTTITKILSILLLCASQSIQAQNLPVLEFSHIDWQLVCDNTRTCRAAGYQSDGDELTLSVLLTRIAGPNQAVKGQLMIGDPEINHTENLPTVFTVSMLINGNPTGKISIDQKSMVTDLTPEQLTALLKALIHRSKIEFVTREFRWHLSDQGAAAVFLKMDEFQGRIGTVGALLKKGKKGEESVLSGLPKPVITVPVIPKLLPKDQNTISREYKAVIQALSTTVDGEDCPLLIEGPAKEKISISRLNDSKLIVTTPCWYAAYNDGAGVWIINNKPPYNPVLVTRNASYYAEGIINEYIKGRGIGDCGDSNSWAWNGKEFVQTEKSTTGMCRLVAAGGAWSLPSIIMDVKQSH